MQYWLVREDIGGKTQCQRYFGMPFFAEGLYWYAKWVCVSDPFAR